MEKIFSGLINYENPKLDFIAPLVKYIDENAKKDDKILWDLKDFFQNLKNQKAEKNEKDEIKDDQDNKTSTSLTQIQSNDSHITQTSSKANEELANKDKALNLLNDIESKNNNENKFVGKKRNKKNEKENDNLKDNDICEKRLENLIIYTKTNERIQKKIIPKKKITVIFEDNIYKFDVIEDITIKNLKKMIYFASGINKSERIQLFHDNKEYNSHPNLQLSFYFPSQESITFDVFKKGETKNNNNNNDDINDNINVNNNINKENKEEKESDNDNNNDSNKENFCPLHFNRNANIFCYDCNKRICSQCIVSGMHQKHKYKNEKNYTQDSRNLVEKLFNDITLNFENIDANFMIEFKDSIKIKIFPSMIQLINGIELKILKIIEEFFNKEKKNVEKVKSIFHILKLEQNKNKKISIDELLSEGAEVLNLKKEENKIKVNEYLNNYRQFKEEMKIIGKTFDKICNEIYSFLDKYLSNDIYEKIIDEIQRSTAIEEDKKELFVNLIIEIKRGPKILSSSKLIKKSDLKKPDKKFHLDNKNLKSKKIFIDEDHYKIIN